jgi:hypothetical protein
MGHLSEHGKEGTWMEGRASEPHRHSDGTYGRDIYVARVEYRHGQKVSEKADYKNWGKVHETSGGK